MGRDGARRLDLAHCPLQTVIWLKVDPEPHGVQGEERANGGPTGCLDPALARVACSHDGFSVDGQTESQAGRSNDRDQFEPQKGRRDGPQTRGSARD